MSSSLGRPRVVAVVGPTAVGKTAVGEGLAQALGGEIVSADSMQVYRGMDIGTAKQPVDERTVPYHCIDLCDPGTPYSAALYQVDARSAIDQIMSRGGVPIIAGGTGLYVRAALDEMDFPRGELESPARRRLELMAQESGPEALHGLLAERDPESAAVIHPRNVRRVVRALEMLDESGVTYAAQAAGFVDRRPFYDSAYIGLTMQRETLYARVNARVDAMMEAGLLEEVARLIEAGFGDAITAAAAIGYKELVPVLEGQAELCDAVEAIKQASRRYAKRQATWFRADPRIMWIDVTESSPSEAVTEALTLLESGQRP